MARNTCMDCVRKHLAQASVLLDETYLGYPHHRFLAVGHLAEAESEALLEHPDFSAKIRAVRLVVMKSYESGKVAVIENLIREAYAVAGEDDLDQHEDPHNSKTFADSRIPEPILETTQKGAAQPISMNLRYRQYVDDYAQAGLKPDPVIEQMLHAAALHEKRMGNRLISINKNPTTQNRWTATWRGKTYTLNAEAYLTNIGGWYGDAGDGEPHLAEYEAGAVGTDGVDYLVRWRFKTIKGQEPEDESSYPFDDQHIFAVVEK